MIKSFSEAHTTRKPALGELAYIIPHVIFPLPEVSFNKTRHYIYVIMTLLLGASLSHIYIIHCLDLISL